MPDASPSPIQAPRGTRDFYPEDFLRRKHVFDAWRSTSLRHGFDEIDGPTFEHLDLYTRKSGEGIVSELFSFRRAGGETDFALRPEFTPTLARMVAAKANALPKPIKWFSIANFFRAERPQRGRLREFVQWNCDFLGDDGTPEGRAAADAECIACCVEALKSFGLTQDDVRIHVNDRRYFEKWMADIGVSPDKIPAAYALMDKRGKLTNVEIMEQGKKLQLPDAFTMSAGMNGGLMAPMFGDKWQRLLYDPTSANHDLRMLEPLQKALDQLGVAEWCGIDTRIVRGLAYYTGTVFEVHEATGAERAIAGGGRYDNLVELFGGPPTPAVGFAMGDVVLSLVLEDKGLLPAGKELRRSVGAAPDVFVISGGSESAESQLQPTLAALRRAGLHARRSYKATKNVGKLRKDAEDAGARFAAILEENGSATLKDFDAGTQEQGVAPDQLAARIRAALRPR